MRRLIRYRGRNRPDLAEGCRERWDWEFLRWIWGYSRRTRPGVLATLVKHGSTHRIAVLKNSRQVRRYLASL